MNFTTIRLRNRHLCPQYKRSYSCKTRADATQIIKHVQCLFSRTQTDTYQFCCFLLDVIIGLCWSSFAWFPVEKLFFLSYTGPLCRPLVPFKQLDHLGLNKGVSGVSNKRVSSQTETTPMDVGINSVWVCLMLERLLCWYCAHFSVML